MRREFHPILLDHMRKDERIWLVVGDLGYGMFNKIRDEFPKRFHNVGAAEQAMMAVAIGLADEGLVPVVYSITPFALWTPASLIRNYINNEKCPVKICGGGRGKDYAHDGFSHWSEDDRDFLSVLPNIKSFWPQSVEELSTVVNDWLDYSGPAFLSLRR